MLQYNVIFVVWRIMFYFLVFAKFRVGNSKAGLYTLQKFIDALASIHEVISYFFLGFAAEADARNCRRKSFFTLANSFRIGTLCRVCFFSLSDGELMTLPDITELFSTDDKCRELLERLRWPEGPTCPRCKTQTVVRLETNTTLLWC